MTKRAILWFRQDLRLHDNPALIKACNQNYDILPIYILDDLNSGPWKMGEASRWWLHRSLEKLNQTLNGQLQFYAGNPKDILSALVAKHKIKAVFWNRCYEPWRIARDTDIKARLKDHGSEIETFNASLLWEPWEIKTAAGTPYKVFTPFYRKGCLGAPHPPKCCDAPKNIHFVHIENKTSINDLKLLPKINWHAQMEHLWQPGEAGAQKRFKDFLKKGLKGYKTLRNRPDMEHCSRLSPHLHFGEISVRQLWHNAHSFAADNSVEEDCNVFCSELGWREFSYSLLFYNPDMTWEPLNQKFKNYPCTKNSVFPEAWQSGKTGFPIVDAGMRQLWQTGWMHNRVRMIVASFLIKNMHIHWHTGEQWFWDTLVDADLASNAASWQWVAGCGADAAPYFRIFNPILQGEKFDPDGHYVRQYVPELTKLPAQYIHKPWDAPQNILKKAQIEIGKTYPRPCLDLKLSRQKALEAYAQIK